MATTLQKRVNRIKAIYDKGNFEKTYTLAFDELMTLYGYKQEPFVIEAVKDSKEAMLAVIASESATHNHKLMARVVLSCAYGEDVINRLIESFAVVTDRNDYLVSKWRKKCLARDNYQCAKCASKENICVHHMSYWSNDPINRINVENGVTLCKKCHKKEHEGDWFSAFI